MGEGRNFFVFLLCITMCCVLCKLGSDNVNAESEKLSKGNNLFSRKHIQPNIILILADDMGWGDMGANWNATLDTPNLDALSRGGLRLTDFHAGASVCAPSRAALLTGRLGLRNGVVRNFAADALGGLPANETTLAEALRAAGYRTAMFGKWHLGLRPGHHPLDHGFDSYLGVPYSVDMGCTDKPTGANLPPCPACPHENDVETFWPWNGAEGIGAANCFEDLALPLVRDRNILHQPLNISTLAEHYVQFAEDFILRGGEVSQWPFLLFAAPAHVHVPLATAPRFARVHRSPLRAALRELDWLVARLAAAAATASRLAPHRDTLLWFLSDNGPWEAKCALAGSAGPFDGAWQRAAMGGSGGSASKRTVWEGGHRVPAFVHWPSRVKGGRVSSALTSALDVLPTLVAVAGGRMPRWRRFDGVDLSAFLVADGKDGVEHLAHRVLYHPNSGAAGKQGEIGAVRIGNNKVVYYSGGAPTCNGASGPSRTLSPPLAFHVASDPAEAHPLAPSAARYPLFAAASALRALADDLRTDNTSTAVYGHSKEARPCCDAGSAICRCPWD